MADELKSAFELAMEKLKAKDGPENGETPLTGEQKAQIAALREDFRARRAEMEILHRSAKAEARRAGDPAKILALEEGFQRDLARLAAEEDAQVSRIRGTQRSV